MSSATHTTSSPPSTSWYGRRRPTGHGLRSSRRCSRRASLTASSIPASTTGTGPASPCGASRHARRLRRMRSPSKGRRPSTRSWRRPDGALPLPQGASHPPQGRRMVRPRLHGRGRPPGLPRRGQAPGGPLRGFRGVEKGAVGGRMGCPHRLWLGSRLRHLCGPGRLRDRGRPRGRGQGLDGEEGR